MNEIDFLEQKIQDIPEEKTSVFLSQYEPYELYMIAVRRGRRYRDTHKEFMIAREASRMSAYVFLQEIKKICPEHYEYFVALANNEMPD